MNTPSRPANRRRRGESKPFYRSSALASERLDHIVASGGDVPILLVCRMALAIHASDYHERCKHSIVSPASEHHRQKTKYRFAALTCPARSFADTTPKRRSKEHGYPNMLASYAASMATQKHT